MNEWIDDGDFWNFVQLLLFVLQLWHNWNLNNAERVTDFALHIF